MTGRMAAVLATLLATAAFAQGDAVEIHHEQLIHYRGPGLDYCTVKGEIENRTRSSFGVRLAWRAYDWNGAVAGTTSEFIEALPAEGRQWFESPAFFTGQLTNCARVTRFERYDVRYYPAR